MKFRMLVTTCILSAVALAPAPVYAEDDDYEEDDADYGAESVEYQMTSKFEDIAYDNESVCDAADPSAALLKLGATKKLIKLVQKSNKMFAALFDIKSKDLKALSATAADNAIASACYAGDEDPVDDEDPSEGDDDFSDDPQGEQPGDGGGEFFPPPPPPKK